MGPGGWGGENGVDFVPKESLQCFKSLKSKGAEGLSFHLAVTFPNPVICLTGLLHLESHHCAQFPWP